MIDLVSRLRAGGLSLCALLIVIVGGPATADEDVIDPVRLRGEWELLSDSLESMDFTSIEHVDERVDRKKREEHYQFLWARGGRSALIVDILEPEGRRRAYDLREDGRLRYQLTHPRHYPDEVSSLQISRQRSSGMRFDAPMPRGLWPIMPFGKSYHQILADGGTLRTTGDNPPGLVLEAREGGLAFEAALTPKNGIPAELRISHDRGTLAIRVTKSAVIHDRWLPVAGEGEEQEFAKDKSLIRDRRFRYELRDIEINQILPPSRFAQPQVPPGVIVTDRVKGKKRIVGGRAARIAWEAQHPRPEDREKVTQPIVAGPEAKLFSPAIGFGLLSAFLALLAIYVRFRPAAD